MPNVQVSNNKDVVKEKIIRLLDKNIVGFVPDIRLKYSVDAVPGRIETRVFIGGNYVLMPILREIAKAVKNVGFQPIIAYDFDIPKEKTRDYSLRLLYQCRYAIFESTLSDGNLIEVARASGFDEIQFLQIYMAMDIRRKPPKTMSVMLWQSKPPPQAYVSIDELRSVVQNFLSPSYSEEEFSQDEEVPYDEEPEPDEAPEPDEEPPEEELPYDEEPEPDEEPPTDEETPDNEEPEQ
jgi:hypothetical protein